MQQKLLSGRGVDGQVGGGVWFGHRLKVNVSTARSGRVEGRESCGSDVWFGLRMRVKAKHKLVALGLNVLLTWVVCARVYRCFCSTPGRFELYCCAE